MSLFAFCPVIISQLQVRRGVKDQVSSLQVNETRDVRRVFWGGGVYFVQFGLTLVDQENAVDFSHRSTSYFFSLFRSSQADTLFCSVAFNGQLLKTDIFEEEEEEVEATKEIISESVSPTPGTKIDSKKAEHTKNEKQKTGGKASTTNVTGKKSGKQSVSRVAGNRASSPSPSLRPASAVEEKEKKPG